VADVPEPDFLEPETLKSEGKRRCMSPLHNMEGSHLSSATEFCVGPQHTGSCLPHWSEHWSSLLSPLIQVLHLLETTSQMHSEVLPAI
jgi:hypothetical protein